MRFGRYKCEIEAFTLWRSLWSDKVTERRSSSSQLLGLVIKHSSRFVTRCLAVHQRKPWLALQRPPLSLWWVLLVFLKFPEIMDFFICTSTSARLFKAPSLILLFALFVANSPALPAVVRSLLPAIYPLSYSTHCDSTSKTEPHMSSKLFIFFKPS